jgi:hypothetical protein
MPVSAKKSSRTGKRSLFFSFLGTLGAIPLNFLAGLIVGLTAPLAVLAGVVGSVYLFTQKVPAISQVGADEATGERSLTLKLMPPDEARAALEAPMAELKETWARLASELSAMASQTEHEPGVRPQ